jgi:very-short-patch-repair endonuclease
MERSGWTVLRVWEHEDIEVARDRIINKIEESRSVP